MNPTTSTPLQPRIAHPAFTVPGAMDALQALGKVLQRSPLPRRLRILAELRASQVNGCAVCLQMHAKEARAAGFTDDELATVAAWREAPYFDDAERAALALTEAMTHVAVPDDVWETAREQLDEEQLAALVLQVATINLWNRLNAATRQVAGAWTA